MNQVCEVEHIHKSFKEKHVLKDITFTVEQGEMVGIKGKSGCGKSTLLNIIGMFEQPDEGKVCLFGEDLPKFGSKKSVALMREKVLYLFQNYALVDEKSIDYNLEIPMIDSKLSKQEKKKAKIEALKKVGLEVDLSKKVYQLSGGEQQRVAIARAFLRDFDLILADEPTGSLDWDNKRDVISLLHNFQKQGKTILIVSHDDDVMEACNRVISL
ncbi:MAG: putative bacteriocin export ABC transporter [Anaerostipes sp.]|nr:putative bacteriocin export ABC transporter [Anaerostipes sp.]MDD3745307.1 putative bacteriocin export ABC transporter [Anaerostipes sp.]